MSSTNEQPESGLSGKDDRPSGKPWPKGYKVFPQMKGRTVERVELYASPDSHCISVCFEDQTDFTVKIDLVTRSAYLEFVASETDRNTGSQQVLESWRTEQHDAP